MNSRKLRDAEKLDIAKVAGATPMWEWAGDDATVFSYQATDSSPVSCSSAPRRASWPLPASCHAAAEPGHGSIDAADAPARRAPDGAPWRRPGHFR